MSREQGGIVGIVCNVGLVTDEMGIYEEVSDLPEQKTHKPLKYTRSAPNEPKPRKNGAKKAKNFTRQSSDKSIDSFQTSHDQTDDIITNTCSNGQVGVAKTAPIPAPKPWKKTSLDTNTSKYNHEEHHNEGNEELYSIPHDTRNTPEPSASLIQEVDTPLESGHHNFDPTGYETWDLTTSQTNDQPKRASGCHFR